MEFFFILLLLAAPAFSLELIGCHLPSNYVVELWNQTKGHVYGGKISVEFSRDKLRAYTYPDTDKVNILLNDTILTFRGAVSLDNSTEPPGNIYYRMNLQAKGVGKLKKRNSNSVLRNCQMYLTRWKNAGYDTPISQRFEEKFHKYTEECLSSLLCEEIGPLRPEDYAVSTNPNEFGHLSVYSRLQKQTLFHINEV